MKVRIREYEAENDTLYTTTIAEDAPTFFDALKHAYYSNGGLAVSISVECEDCQHLLDSFDINLELLREAFHEQVS